MTRIVLGAVGKANEVRALWTDPDVFDWRRALGATPRRAGRIGVIEEGPCAGLFSTDMSLLGEGHEVCLWPPAAAYKEAVASEERWVRERYVLRG